MYVYLCNYLLFVGKCLILGDTLITKAIVLAEIDPNFLPGIDYDFFLAATADADYNLLQNWMFNCGDYDIAVLAFGSADIYAYDCRVLYYKITNSVHFLRLRNHALSVVVCGLLSRPVDDRRSFTPFFCC